MMRLLVTADRLFDGTGSATVARPILHIAEDRIETVTRSGSATPSPGLEPVPPAPERFDFPGCTILPGLIDTHVHLVMAALETNAAIIEQVGRESPEQPRARAETNACAALHAGLTTIRDCGGKGGIIQDLRDAIHRGEVEGPDILSCGMPITSARGTATGLA